MKPITHNTHQFTVMKLMDTLNEFLYPTLTLRLFSACTKKQHCRHNTNHTQSFPMNITDATVHKDVHDVSRGVTGQVPTGTYRFKT